MSALLTRLALRTGNFALFDIDGTLARGSGKQSRPNTPPAELVEIIDRLSLNHDVILVTGQPTSIAAQMREMLGGLHGAPIAPEYGSLLVTADGEIDHLLPEDVVTTFTSLHDEMATRLESLGAEIDQRNVQTGINAFWKHANDFTWAKREWEEMVRKDTSLHGAFINSGSPTLRHQWNHGDFSANVLPVMAGKHNAVAWALTQGHIVLGAGDTSSDLPLLKAAEHPLACFDHGEALHSGLTSHVKGRDTGYIAHRPHGFGTLDGLLKARSAGHIRF